MATRKFRKFNEGGEAADKEAGLKASKDEKVGFFERMRMGNIDQEGSEAYNRFGAGRGKSERAKNVPVEDMKPTSSKIENVAAEKEDELEAANKREPIPVPAGPKANQPKPGGRPNVDVQESKPAVNKTPAKAPAKTVSKADTSNYSNEGRSKPAVKSDTSNYSNEGRGRAMTKKQQAEYGIDSIRPTAEQTQKGMETAASVMGGVSLKGLHNLAKKAAGTASKPAGSRALSTAVDDGVTFLGRSGGRQVGGFPEVGRSGARQLADGSARRLPSPTKKLEAPSRTKASDARRNSEDDDLLLGMKRGGKVKSSSSSSKPAAKGWGMARGARAAKMR
jgi:hypothetical protein